ncbi:membrane protein implicated in regulation of membrane protease activity [Archangium gephyra]|uniref:Activity regulator of membrane protease YbbK n=1 Tax=Archangium gephyra TaxID=48 RepID=A0AAC8QB56_9BACT|nr:NfeD family protein [Archangium gephyra]AKJ04204.1 Putative activity regulator of membrane protease YbbK [Archangium gephyra]REG37716.1 membrane protein implicated in regulation of membrane protease activity [Archangium gephyra]
MDIEVWHLWVLAAIIGGALEMALPGFVVLWFAVGSLAAGLTAALGLGINLQLAIFMGVSLALFGGSRTIFKKAFMRNASRMKTGVEAMVGQEAVVTEALAEGHGGGTVRINGELWSARTLGGGVAVGELVIVEQVEGLKLWVRRPAASLEVSPQQKKEGR